MINNEKNDWRNVSERGMNKVIMPVTKKRDQPVSFPLQWVDEKTNETCFINNGFWGWKTSWWWMFLIFPSSQERREPSSPGTITHLFWSGQHHQKGKGTRQTQLHYQISTSNEWAGRRLFKKMKYYVHFTDDVFGNSLHQPWVPMTFWISCRKHPVWNSRSFIRYVCRLGKAKSKNYFMNLFSRFFEFGYIDKETRSDGIIQSREYYVGFNTILGEIFAHNLLSKNYDWVEPSFYTLPIQPRSSTGAFWSITTISGHSWI